jgi:DNA polymerase III sliding clamp (beta) subunit (PCNA family)
MKITINRGDLLELMGKLKAALPKKGRYVSLNVIRTVLLRTEKGRLVATANNLEFCLTASCKAKVTSGGSICVDAEPLIAFLKAVTSETITLSSSNKLEKWTEKEAYWDEQRNVQYKNVPKSHRLLSARLEAGNAATTIQGNDQVFEAKDFPPVPKVKGKSLTMTLAPGLEQVDYAVGTEANRPILCGISFRQVGSKVELAAADGFRLAVTSVKTKGTLTREMVVDAQALSVVKRLMPKMVSITETVKKEVDKDGNAFTFVEAVSFEAADMVLVARAIRGQYPDYHQLIPATKTGVTVAREAILEALKVIAGIKPESEKVCLQTKGKNLIVWAKGDAGRTEVKVPARGTTRIAFHLRYLREIIQKVDGTVTLRTKSPSEPGVVKQNGTTHVLMPMFVQWDEKPKAKTVTETAQNQAETGTESVPV